jgi:geranylgeranyl diphosphate synthase, type I
MTDVQRAGATAAKSALPECLARHRLLIDDALRGAVDRLPPAVHTAAAYHFGWCDADGREVAGNGGKAIRPAMTLLAAEACGARPETALSGAVALELVHNYSLVHDDLMDGDAERRHRATVWAVFGAGQAIIVGDALAALAQELLLDDARGRDQAAAELCRATAEMIEGQAHDLEFETRLQVSVVEGLQMSAQKTGALLGCAGALGAILAGADEASVAALRVYGRNLGIAFQAVDDVLGIWGDTRVTGKPTASDLRQRKKTLPILHALESSTSAAVDLRALLAGSDELVGRRLETAVALLDESDGRAWTLELAAHYLAEALTALEGCALAPGAAADLREAALFIVGRDF